MTETEQISNWVRQAHVWSEIVAIENAAMDALGSARRMLDRAEVMRRTNGFEPSVICVEIRKNL